MQSALFFFFFFFFKFFFLVAWNYEATRDGIIDFKALVSNTWFLTHLELD